MKKRVLALIGAITLTIAMSLNVCAAGSVTADDISNADKDAGATIKVELEGSDVVASIEGVAGEVKVSTDNTVLAGTAATVSAAQVNEEKVTLVYVAPVSSKEAVEAVVAAAKVLTQPPVEGVSKVTEVSEMTDPIEITPPVKGETITMAFNLANIGVSAPADDTEQIWAIDCDTNKVFVGEVKDGKVYFTSDDFSKYVITRVKVEKQAAAPSTSQPPYNPDWDPAVQAQRKAEAQAQHEAAWAAYLASGGTIPVVAIAPKTGDMVAMVGIMAVIFLGGAATAVIMSKKRA